ncbi:glycosyltransferase family 4 protein [Rhodobacterales bacterium FZCC0083]|nr:glycosyltransferase family 4 protein [Rhodobacterales bacterium FZCC0083]
MKLLSSTFSWNYLKLKKIPYEKRRRSLIHYYLMNLNYKILFLLPRKKYNSKIPITNKVFFKHDEGDWVLSKISGAVYEGIKQAGGVVDTSNKKPCDGYTFYEHYLPYSFDLARGLVKPNSGIIWFTHLRQHSCSPQEIVHALNKSALVVFQCQSDYDTLTELGFCGKSAVLNGGVDPVWKTLQLKESAKCDFDLLISSRMYERKNPRAYRKLIESAPNLKFLFIGKGWDIFSEYSNVEVKDISYDEYPSYYARCKSLLSLSIVEGGPLCILEALACGLPVIMSETGYYKELSRSGLAYLDTNFHLRSEKEIKQIILSLQTNRDEREFTTTWTEFGRKFASIINKCIN